MSSRGKRGVVIGGVLVVVAVVVAAVVLLRGGGSGAPGTTAAADSGPAAATPTAAAQQYLQAFGTDDVATAGLLTDDPNACTGALKDAWNSLRPNDVKTTLGTVGPAAGTTATAAYTAAWTLGPAQVWTYTGTFGLTERNGNWRVHWTPAVLQPTLQAGQRLVLTTKATQAPVVVDRDGVPLVVSGSGGPAVAKPEAFPLLHSALTAQAPTSTATGAPAVERVDASGTALATLFGGTGATTAVKATLSTSVEKAAQAAVDGYTAGPAVVLAIQPSDGGLVAVAQNATAQGSPFSGLYAPGSTFKIVTATAVLEAGIATPSTALPCPLTEQIGTRTISNEGFDLGTTTMSHAFARSCNTTFGSLASRLPANGLAKAAAQYGLAADYDIPGLTTQTGDVKPAADPDEQVEDGIGQGTVQVSPFGEALMAATVAAGHPVTPKLWQSTAPTTVNTGYSAPSAGTLASLRGMMREVVTAGTATGLAHSGTVYGKTGTAQFGDGAQANGWFTGYRGDLAFVVFLPGANDSKPAVTVGAAFLGKLS